MTDLRKKYRDEIAPELSGKLGCGNALEVPRLRKIVVSTGIGSDKERDAFTEARKIISIITGQTPVVTKSKKNVANFKLRRGMPVGAMVTLRGARMYEFLFRLVNVALPRVRDFRGISRKGFDGSGNYNFGIRDVSVFTEVDLDQLKHSFGVNVAFATDAKDDESAYELLRMLDLPFAS